MRAYTTQRWLFYALLLPFAVVTAVWWAMQIHVYLGLGAANFLIPSGLLSQVGPPDLDIEDDPLGMTSVIPYDVARTSLSHNDRHNRQWAAFAFSHAIPCFLCTICSSLLVVWILVFAARSLRTELRLLLSSTVLAFTFFAWAMLGELILNAVHYPGHIYVQFTVIKYVLSWTFWLALLAVYLWERIYVQKHFSKTEWSASLQTLDTWEAAVDADDQDFNKEEETMFLRGDALDYTDPQITPYREQCRQPQRSGKAYDLPPVNEEPESDLHEAASPAPAVTTTLSKWREAYGYGTPPESAAGPSTLATKGSSTWKGEASDLPRVPLLSK